jgi:hypothetical protein
MDVEKFIDIKIEPRFKEKFSSNFNDSISNKSIVGFKETYNLNDDIESLNDQNLVNEKFYEFWVFSIAKEIIEFEKRYDNYLTKLEELPPEEKMDYAKSQLGTRCLSPVFDMIIHDEYNRIITSGKIKVKNQELIVNNVVMCITTNDKGEVKFVGSIICAISNIIVPFLEEKNNEKNVLYFFGIIRSCVNERKPEDFIKHMFEHVENLAILNRVEILFTQPFQPMKEFLVNSGYTNKNSYYYKQLVNGGKKKQRKTRKTKTNKKKRKSKHIWTSKN